MKYKPDINKIPDTDHVSSDRQEVRRRRRAVAKFGETIGDKFWWKSLSDDHRWEIYVDYCWFKRNILGYRIPNTNEKEKFLQDIRKKYPGDVSLLRDMKIDELFKNK